MAISSLLHQKVLDNILVSSEDICVCIAPNGQKIEATMGEVFGTEDCSTIRNVVISMTLFEIGLEVIKGEHKFYIYHKIIKDALDSLSTEEKVIFVEKVQKQLFPQETEKKEEPGFVYAVTINNEFVKIGHSQGTPENHRLPGLQTASPYPLVLRSYLMGNFRTEKLFHSKFKEYRSKGEWFDIKILPALDWFFDQMRKQTSLKEMNNYLKDTSLNLAWTPKAKR